MLQRYRVKEKVLPFQAALGNQNNWVDLRLDPEGQDLFRGKGYVAYTLTRPTELQRCNLDSLDDHLKAKGYVNLVFSRKLLA